MNRLLTSTDPPKAKEQLVVTYLKGFTSRPIVVPTIYAIRFFCTELESSLTTLIQSPELMDLLGSLETERLEIQESLQRIRSLFEEFLIVNLRK